jgi:sugar lactone lactonase YvrE
VSRASGVITTVAGTGAAGFSGDGGPARDARLDAPLGLALDPSGDLFVADTFNARIRRVAAGSGVISTWAGTGDSGFSGDGGPAASAGISPRSLAIDADGTGLAVVEDNGNRVRRISFDTTVIFTIAGNGQSGYLGDLGPATSAALRMPFGTAIGPDGDLYVSDTENQRIRRVDREDRTISTYAGGGTGPDGGPAESAALLYPSGIAFDGSGNLLVAEIALGTVRKVDRATGLIRVVAGGGTQAGDGGPATSARLASPWSLAADRSGNLFIAERDGFRVRKVDASGVITTAAGTGTEGYDGDGGPAALAKIGPPRGVALDPSGNLYVSTEDGRIRRVDSGSGRISTFAGGGSSVGDGGPATQARLEFPAGLSIDATGNVFVAETGSQRIRRIDAATRVVTTVAGTEIIGFYGDGGPAVEAGLTYPEGVTVDAEGNLYVADTYANRIRAVPACTTVAAPVLASPAPGATTASGGAYLSWNAAKGAFRYDVYLDTVSPPERKVAENVVDTLYAVANLDAGTAYYWAVTAKGDPY